MENEVRGSQRNITKDSKPISTWSYLWFLVLSRFSPVWLCVTPWTAAHQAPPSLGFSRQERWSGLPVPSPMHESEKWKWSCSVMSNSSWPHGLQPTRLLRPWDFPGKSTGGGCHCLLQSRYSTTKIVVSYYFKDSTEDLTTCRSHLIYADEGQEWNLTKWKTTFK